FEPRERKVLKEDAERSYKLYGVPPLSFVEKSLYISSSVFEALGPTDDVQRTTQTLFGYMVATSKHE
ncbi:hypothetical protein FRC07_010688, partial [Ceratobasidium sp. 392]